jgi:hypothetical protein
MQLFPYLPFRPDETVLSWATRLAAFHTGGRLVPFLNDLEIPPMELAAGSDGVIRRLCAKGGEAPENVRHNVIQHLAPRLYKLRGETFSASFTTGQITRFCPACLAADDLSEGRVDTIRAHRLTWNLQAVRVCPYHGVPLFERRAGGWDDYLHELPPRVPETRDELLRLADLAPAAEPAGLQGYILARLEGRSGPDWLDRQPIESAARATEMLGAVLAFGAAAKPGDLSSMDWIRAATSGWAYVSQGEGGVRAALSELQVEAKGRGRAWLSRNGVFGMLYRWVASSKSRNEPGEIQNLLRQHIVETMDVAPGEVIFGQVIEKPKVCSVTTLAKSYKVHVMTLRDVLIARGVLGADAASTCCSELLVDAIGGCQAVEAIRRAVPVTSVARLINASRPMVSTLIDIGVLTQVRSFGEARGKLSRSVDKRDLRALLQRLVDLAPITVDCVPEGMVTIATLVERTRLTNERVLRRFLDGKLRRAYRLASIGGFGGVVVDPREFISVDATPLRGMSLDLAKLVFGLSTAALNSLVREREGGALLEVVEAPGGYRDWVTRLA